MTNDATLERIAVLAREAQESNDSSNAFDALRDILEVIESRPQPAVRDAAPLARIRERLQHVEGLLAVDRPLYTASMFMARECGDPTADKHRAGAYLTLKSIQRRLEAYEENVEAAVSLFAEAASGFVFDSSWIQPVRRTEQERRLAFNEGKLLLLGDATSTAEQAEPTRALGLIRKDDKA